MLFTELDCHKNHHYCEPGDSLDPLVGTGLLGTGLKPPEKPKAEDKVGDAAVNIMFGFVYAVLAMIGMDCLVKIYNLF